MPLESQAQRGFLNWKFGHAWTKKHHFDTKGKLPKYAHREKAIKNAKKNLKKAFE